ncbi:MAG: hypothetical protein MJE68_25760, partial [Proteobacteria bacterium]|nr:hypothetical protein [Pseudomonadota bacterium]
VLLSPTSNAGRTSRVLLADEILSINKASLALFIACTRHATTDVKFGSCIYYAVEFISFDSSIEI